MYLQYRYVTINLNVNFNEDKLHTNIEYGISGAGVNLSNSKPTTCINDLIIQYNQKHGTKLDTFSYEKYLALVFNELENNLDKCQNDNMDSFYEFYYKYWLHK